jgi:hypothetical protein
MGLTILVIFKMVPTAELPPIGIETVLPLTEEHFRQIAECLGFHVLWFASGMALMDWSGERMIVWVGYDRENAFKRMATVRGKLMRRQRCQRMGARKGNVNYPHLAGDETSREPTFWTI